jgi:LuxR family maltose regulon positive regulatory protein
VDPAALPGAADTQAAPAVRDGVVSRPVLFERLTSARRVVQVSAQAGSGKTVLLRSWIAESGLAKRAAWVSVHGEHDPQRFWVSVAGALRDTAVGSALVRGLTAAPGLDGWTLVERLLEDLAALDDQVWLVIDDLHELNSAEALSQLELLIMRAPPACGSSWSPAMTCGWACTGCGWQVSLPRSARPICVSPWLRRARCSTRPACPCPMPR